MEAIPPDMRQFIRQHISSMDHMEVLMRMHDSPERVFTRDELQQLAHVDGKTLDRCLLALLDSELIREASAGAFQFGPRTVALRRDADALALLYHQRPVTLVKFVYEQPATPVKSFADAFRLRRDPEER